MKELAVISGKGGTGKTSLAAAFAVLARRPVIVDGDVDAADMHLLLAPVVRERHDVIGGRRAVIRADDCTGCGLCGTLCRFGAVLRLPPGGIPAAFDAGEIGDDHKGSPVAERSHAANAVYPILADPT